MLPRTDVALWCGRHWGRLLSVLVLASFLGASPAWADADKEKRDVPLKDSSKYLSAFKEAVTKVSYSTVRVQCDGKDVALGAVVSRDGWILTKASELKSSPSCVLRDGRRMDARIVGIYEPYDLAMLKVEAKDLVPVDWLASEKVHAGNWLVTPGPREDAVAAGVVSVDTRKLDERQRGPATPTKGGYLGVLLDQEAKNVRIKDFPPDGSAAKKAGILVGDVVLAVNGKPVDTMEVLTGVLQKANPGDVVTLKVRRGEEELDVKVTLDKRRPQGLETLGGRMSDRRGAFPVVLQHDTVLRPEDCGGPLVNLDGKVVGINIARSGRVESLAIPTEAVMAVLTDLESGKLAPAELVSVNKDVEAARAVVKQAEAKLVDAEKELARAKKLLDDAEAKSKVAKKDGK